MNDEKWQALVQLALKNFDDVSYTTKDLLAETADGTVKQGSQDVLEFRNDNGHFRVVRENKPVVLDKKMHYSHRAGESARTEYTLSETEFSHKIQFYIEDDLGEWTKLESENLNIFQ